MANNRENLELHGPGGWWAKMDGINISTILLLCIMCLIGFFLWQQSDREFKANAQRDDANKQAFLAQHGTTQTLLKEILANQIVTQKAIIEGQQRAERVAAIQTYVLTLNEKERKELRLSMPDELRVDRRGR